MRGMHRIDQKPFQPLPTARSLSRDDLPTDLANFYSHNEGVGLESSPDRLVRLCLLNEVQRIGWSDLHVFGSEPIPGWEQFSGYRVGISSFFDEIIYTVHSPCCPAGCILAIGVNISGPGGNGPHPFECSLVLAPTWNDWLSRLEALRWVEYGLLPDEVTRLPPRQQQEQLDYYRSLNPQLEWEQSGPKPWWQFW